MILEHLGVPESKKVINRQKDEGRVRERETQNLKQAPSTESDAGLELTDCEIMTGAQVGHLTD